MAERLRFVTLLIEGEAMTDLCREFGISRKTDYKIFDCTTRRTAPQRSAIAHAGRFAM